MTKTYIGTKQLQISSTGDKRLAEVPGASLLDEENEHKNAQRQVISRPSPFNGSHSPNSVWPHSRAAQDFDTS
jgi:hypothetical protein